MVRHEPRYSYHTEPSGVELSIWEAMRGVPSCMEGKGGRKWVQCAPTPQESFISACQSHILWAFSVNSTGSSGWLGRHISTDFLFSLFCFWAFCSATLHFWRVATSQHQCVITVKLCKHPKIIRWVHHCKGFYANKHWSNSLYQICRGKNYAKDCTRHKNIILVLNVLINAVLE